MINGHTAPPTAATVDEVSQPTAPNPPATNRPVTPLAPAVAELTARWLRALPLDHDTVVSGAGVWPLLALLAGAADGPAALELAAATGRAGDDAAAAAAELLGALDVSPDVATAVGTWVRDNIELAPWWTAHAPAGTLGRLTGNPAADRPALDAWAHEHTDGLITKMPVDVDANTLLVLASAIVLHTTWAEPFQPGERAGRTLLRRVSPGLADVRLVGSGANATTVITVRGQADVDVELAIGASECAAADVIGQLLTGSPTADGATLLDDPSTAPGCTVRAVAGSQPSTSLELPPFDIHQRHDLLAHAEVFGLSAATGPQANFPRLSPTPLGIGAAAQDVLARFYATGFEAAAVTAFAMRASAIRRDPVPTRQLAVTLDRPFGFAAVHRPTGVAIFAGWVADAFR